ncbi:MAG: radical SAM protein [Candidatus Nanoarchaeia archaeon]|nr:radical SAM protein [Candidatus Nanoarchaeia archaeon]MDD5358172.1 radical SAM protein [Candidatus Nanoarchaeia archaeon]MDD5589438.1 radical SAM protein [Candidatus Nanoarchaeia archaeon]
MGKKILLIEPLHKEVDKGLPLGIAYLGAVLRKEGHDVSIIDANINSLDYEKIVEKIKDREIDICGISATTVQIKEAWRILELLKNKRPEIISILGGVHPTALPEESLEKPYVDFVLRGEGEKSILDFIKSISDKSFSKVKGLSYKIKKGGKIKIFHNENPPQIEDLDSLPFPAWDLFEGFPECYTTDIRKNFKADILTSRGCIGACNFCSRKVHGYKVRARSPENVIQEMEELYHKYGIDYFHIVDDYFTADMERAEKICDLIIERKLNIKWICSNGIRVDNINLDLLKKMKKAGCLRVAFGVESGSDEILKKIGKNTSLEQIKRAFDLAQEANLITIAYFMIGNIWENEQTINQTIKFAKSLNTDYAQFLIVKPYPGTALYDLIEKNVNEAKFLIKDWDKYAIFNSPVVFTTKDLSEELIIKMHKKANDSFYLRPKQILFILYKRIITRTLELDQLLNLTKYFFTNKR